MKRAILLAAFGSSAPEARRSLERFGARTAEAFPGLTVRWAFTSGMIRSRLAGEGKKTDSVEKALAKLWFERFTAVAVQSLHVIPGADFDQLTAEVGSLAESGKAFTSLTIGAPLLATRADAEAAAKALLAHLPPERGPGDAVVFMGHGTWHKGDSRYDDLAEILTSLDPLAFLGTLEHSEGVDELLPRLKDAGVSRVFLIPLLAVPGYHVLTDMAGDGPDSWASRIRAAGFVCTPVLTGSAENPGLAAIWLAHLQTALTELSA